MLQTMKNVSTDAHPRTQFDFGLIIDGEEVASSSGATFETIDPATGQAFATIAQATEKDVDLAVMSARRAFEGEWRQTSAADRGRLLQRTSRQLLKHIDAIAELEVRDSGKVLDQAVGDVKIAARYLELFGNFAAGYNGNTIPVSPDMIDFATREPFGVSAQINAWNFPINMAARSIGAALAAGNTVVVKTPELAPVTTTILVRILHEEGMPAGVVNVVHGSGRVIGDAITGHPGVDVITFTGSTDTGKKVATSAAQMITPVIMELGGKSPVVVFEDADLEKAARDLAAGFVEANGQSCDLPSLAVVQEDVYERFVEMLSANVSAFTVGPGIDNPDVGALISTQQLDRVAGFVVEATESGARIATGGDVLDHRQEGFFFRPTVIADVTPDMAIAQEEVFGPVLAVVRFRDEAEAVRIANGTRFGLSSVVWTKDLARGMRMTRAIDAGQVYVNCFSSGDSPMLPFGGFKDSGYGREKGQEAINSYSQLKNVCISTLG